MFEPLEDAVFTLMGWGLPPLGLGLAWGVRRLWRRAGGWRLRWRRAGRVAALLLGVVAAAALVGGAYGLWVRYRPQPADVERTLHPGIHYRRFSRSRPRPMVVHVVTIDLRTRGLSLVPTADATDGCLPARTTSSFLRDYDVQLAINTQFFYACPDTAHSEPIIAGQPLRPVGRAAAAGEVIVDGEWKGNTVYVARDGTVSLYDRPASLHHAISGRYRLVEHGRAVPASDEVLAPRLALGFDASRRTMTVVLVDGRQRGYSEGLSLPELSALLVELGVDDAIELDGGGSATLVVADEDGRPQVLNSPIHRRVPGRERPVANHLGVSVGG
ncbi:MAG: phosphodiester glycosidase family protein [Nannocystaceae bacterium]